jgi:hypothetical protein
MADPVSWLVVEPGWKVRTADGADVGYVESVLGDRTTDIFDGLSVSAGPVAKPQYVPAERVAAIVEGRLELSLTAEEAQTLPRADEPGVTGGAAAGPEVPVAPATVSLEARPRLGARLGHWFRSRRVAS